MTLLKKVSDININQHGLIEASAGTGKTYTIENLTIRIIKEKKITLDKILIVTFTEKATGELKKRIREKLEAEKNNSTERIENIYKNIKQYKEAESQKQKFITDGEKGANCSPLK